MHQSLPSPSDGTNMVDSIQTRDSIEGRTVSESLIQETLFQLTNGLPQRELRHIISEANECEVELLKDIELLEQALADAEKEEEGADNNAEKILSSAEVPPPARLGEILQSTLTPLDRYWTVSSVLGRLRDDMTLPSILIAIEGDSGGVLQRQLQGQFTPSSPTASSSILSLLSDHPRYTERHDTTNQLLAVWRKISSHRSSLVFKRPVKPEEAPGYLERIVFPMDLSMIKKMIMARQVVNFSDLHRYIALISHNCVKFNGRENDYGRVASEFEAAADGIIRQAVLNSSPTRSSAVATVAATTPTTMGNQVPENNKTTHDDTSISATVGPNVVISAATTNDGTSAGNVDIASEREMTANTSSIAKGNGAHLRPVVNVVSADTAPTPTVENTSNS